MRLRRSLHFVPGGNEKMLDKAESLPADAIIYDLEDSVTSEGKEVARREVCARLALGYAGSTRERLVRVNPFDSLWGKDDLAALLEQDIDGVVLPKVTALSAVEEVWAFMRSQAPSKAAAEKLPRLVIIGTEEAGAVFNLPQMSSHPSVDGLTWGAEDLSVSLGSRRKRNSEGDYLEVFGFVRAYCLLAAKAAGVQAIDSVYTDVRDLAGLCRESETAADMGFTGKLTIHPDQIEVVNAAFTPSTEEIEGAKALLSAFEENRQQGKQAFRFEGAMVDVPHLKRAKNLLEIAEQIARATDSGK